MLNELKNFNSGYLSRDIYISSDGSEFKKIDQKYWNDWIYTVEIESNAFRPFLIGKMVVNSNLFRLSIGKDADALDNEVFLRITFTDMNHGVFDRVFKVDNTKCTVYQNDKSSDMYVISLIDIYGYFMNIPSSTLSKSHTYNDTPVEITKQLLAETFDCVQIYYKEWKLNPIKLKIQTNSLTFAKNNQSKIVYKCQQNKTTIENLNEFCQQNNILIYQDFDTFHIIQNIDYSKLEKKTSQDGTMLFCEGISEPYPYKICDKLRQQSSTSMLDKPNVNISLNSGGKTQTTEKIDFDNFIKSIELNENSEEFKKIKNEKNITESSGTNGLSSIIYEYTNKYIKSNNLVIFVTPIIDVCKVGTITSTKVSVHTEFKGEQLEGDYRYSGYWLLRSSTLKLVDRNFIARLVLCRFDNQKDTIGATKEDVITVQKNDEIYPTSKPEMPINISQRKQESRSETTSFSDIKKPAETVKIDVTEEIKRLDPKKIDLTTQKGIENLNDFKKRIEMMNKQIKDYVDISKKENQSKTNKVKRSVNDHIDIKDVAKNGKDLIRKNAKTLSYVDNILRKETGIQLNGTINEIKNIDNVTSDLNLNNVDRMSNKLTSQMTNTSKNVLSAMTQTITTAPNVVATLNKRCENTEDAINNVESSISQVKSLYNKIESTKNNVNNTINSIKNIKKEVESLNPITKVENTLDKLKNKRNNILNKLKLK